MSTPTQLQSEPSSTPAEIDWSLGWRYEMIKLSNGRSETIRIPLTAEERLHPQEGYVMPERTEHDTISDDLCDMLRPLFFDRPDMAVFRNLVFQWDVATIKDFAPDVAVVPNVQERDRNRGSFNVSAEGTRPSLVIEIVSPSSRTADRVDKVRDYARLGVAEYVYLDSRRYRGETIWEVTGYRLTEGQYLPLLPDEDNAIYLESVNLRIGVEVGQVWLEDANTTEELLTNLQVRQQLQIEKLARESAESRANEAETRAQVEAEARRLLEARLAELEAQLSQK